MKSRIFSILTCVIVFFVMIYMVNDYLLNNYIIHYPNIILNLEQINNPINHSSNDENISININNGYAYFYIVDNDAIKSNDYFKKYKLSYLQIKQINEYLYNMTHEYIDYNYIHEMESNSIEFYSPPCRIVCYINDDIYKSWYHPHNLNYKKLYNPKVFNYTYNPNLVNLGVYLYNICKYDFIKEVILRTITLDN